MLCAVKHPKSCSHPLWKAVAAVQGCPGHCRGLDNVFCFAQKCWAVSCGLEVKGTVCASLKLCASHAKNSDYSNQMSVVIMWVILCRGLVKLDWILAVRADVSARELKDCFQRAHTDSLSPDTATLDGNWDATQSEQGCKNLGFIVARQSFCTGFYKVLHRRERQDE